MLDLRYIGRIARLQPGAQRLRVIGVVDRDRCDTADKLRELDFGAAAALPIVDLHGHIPGARRRIR
ncbi:MAG: hypothetical protein JSV41_05540, partial [Gemmatimonadota bacterium]